jgi:hypothetical protein
MEHPYLLSNLFGTTDSFVWNIHLSNLCTWGTVQLLDVIRILISNVTYSYVVKYRFINLITVQSLIYTRSVLQEQQRKP